MWSGFMTNSLTSRPSTVSDCSVVVTPDISTLVSFCNAVRMSCGLGCGSSQNGEEFLSSLTRNFRTAGPISRSSAISDVAGVTCSEHAFGLKGAFALPSSWAKAVVIVRTGSMHVPISRYLSRSIENSFNSHHWLCAINVAVRPEAIFRIRARFFSDCISISEPIASRVARWNGRLER